MNCDDAFECLTDPASGRQDELQAHLAHCSRCRQMREVLAPALALFKPAGAAGDVDFAPHPFENARRQPLVTPETVRIAQNAAAQLRGSDHKDRALLRRMIGLSIRYSTALAIGACVAFAMAVFSHREDGQPVASARCLWSDDVELEHTLEMRAPQLVATCVSCHLESAPNQMRPAAEGPDRCLWKMAQVRLVAATEPAPRPASRAVVVSCVDCHLQKAEHSRGGTAALLPTSAEVEPGSGVDRILPAWGRGDSNRPVAYAGWADWVVLLSEARGAGCRTPA